MTFLVKTMETYFGRPIVSTIIRLEYNHRKSDKTWILYVNKNTKRYEPKQSARSVSIKVFHLQNYNFRWFFGAHYMYTFRIRIKC